ncbi:hypothetical protein AU476_25140 [Cupriavidus sp. UYMSc13B]|nr:hypothetical protein AU476_25140 [Cupriavidus sp. UYMSc13B]
MLHIGPLGRESTFENAVAGAARMSIKPKAAQDIVGRVQDVASRRHEYYARAGLADEEMKIIDRCLSAWHDLERREEDVEPARWPGRGNSREVGAAAFVPRASFAA